MNQKELIFLDNCYRKLFQQEQATSFYQKEVERLEARLKKLEAQGVQIR